MSRQQNQPHYKHADRIWVSKQVNTHGDRCTARFGHKNDLFSTVICTLKKPVVFYCIRNSENFTVSSRSCWNSERACIECSIYFREAYLSRCLSHSNFQGDLILQFRVVFPERLTADARKKLSELLPGKSEFNAFSSSALLSVNEKLLKANA